MIETLYGLGRLDSPAAMLLALLVGAAFGACLERAGFGSSRKMANLFYFRDMTVVKVMFTAVVTAMLGLVLCRKFGWIDDSQLYLMPSIYGAQIVGGLIFGVGFVMGGWCPGTAAVGAASGKSDAMIFLGGAALGSVLFNELYDLVAPLQNWGDAGVQLVWQSLGISQGAFVVLFGLAAVGCFWGVEYLERRVTGGSPRCSRRFLTTFSVVLAATAIAVALWPATPGAAIVADTAPRASSFLAAIEAGADHVEPDELADRLLSGDPGLMLVDIRTPEEYAAFHIRGAVNSSMADLPALLAKHAAATTVLYSNGMTHPVQGRDELARMGYRNVFVLTDGLKGFIERCLKPASLRSEPLPPAQVERIAAWRRYFLESDTSRAATVSQHIVDLPKLVDTAWLAENLGRPDIHVIDVRAQPAYNTSHIPGAVCLNPESFRGVVGGVSSMLLPADMLARHMSLMGIRPDDAVVLVPPEKMQDATLLAIGLQRLGHRKVSLLNGGFDKWANEKRPTSTALPQIALSDYPANMTADRFTVDYRTVLEAATTRRAVILDVRPADYFTGKKSDEARPGHIPGAINRPFSEDVATLGQTAVFKPIDELAKAYATLIPSKDATIIVHCRTGHQASQTFFVLGHLLGYRNVKWYDAGWSEWAARPELPAER